SIAGSEECLTPRPGGGSEHPIAQAAARPGDPGAAPPIAAGPVRAFTVLDRARIELVRLHGVAGAVRCLRLPAFNVARGARGDQRREALAMAWRSQGCMRHTCALDRRGMAGSSRPVNAAA